MAGRQLVDAREVGAAMRVSPRMVLRLAERARLPHYRVGRLIRFDLEEVLTALKREAGNGAAP